jgi:hypothetical protein
MAYVVARPSGRFEVRESQHTPRGPRARTLAGFRVLNERVLAKAASRASRPFDAQAVLLSGERAGAPVEQAAAKQDTRVAHSAFVAASHRMARATSRPRRDRAQADPGSALIELLGFADAVTRSQPSKPATPLDFPVLARLAEKRARGAGHGRRAAAKSRR